MEYESGGILNRNWLRVLVPKVEPLGSILGFSFHFVEGEVSCFRDTICKELELYLNMFIIYMYTLCCKTL